jgi:hypothetical protein
MLSKAFLIGKGTIVGLRSPEYRLEIQLSGAQVIPKQRRRRRRRRRREG